MISNKGAGFLLRWLASLLDWHLLFFFPFVLLLSYAAGSTSVSELGTRLVILSIVLVTSFLVGIFYGAMTTYWWGGTIGKLLTGLRVTDEAGKPMGFKRLFFRHTVGYQFSFILFGLGFYSIIKDKNKQGWHDKAVGSNVVVAQTLWPLALILLVALLAFNLWFSVYSVNGFLNGNLYKNELAPLLETQSPTQVPNPLLEDGTI